MIITVESLAADMSLRASNPIGSRERKREGGRERRRKRERGGKEGGRYWAWLLEPQSSDTLPPTGPPLQTIIILLNCDALW